MPSIFSKFAMLPGKLTKKSHKFRFFKDKLVVIPIWTLFHFRSSSIRSCSNLDPIPPLCNWAYQHFRSYSIISYYLDLIPPSSLEVLFQDLYPFVFFQIANILIFLCSDLMQMEFFLTLLRLVFFSDSRIFGPCHVRFFSTIIFRSFSVRLFQISRFLGLISFVFFFKMQHFQILFPSNRFLNCKDVSRNF